MNFSNETSNKRNSVGKGHSGQGARITSFYRRLHSLPDTTDSRSFYQKQAAEQRQLREAQALARRGSR